MNKTRRECPGPGAGLRVRRLAGGMRMPSKLLVLGALAWVAGCETVAQRERDRQLREQSEQAALQAEFRRIEGRLEGLEMQNENLHRRVQALEERLKALPEEQAALARPQLDALAQKIQEVEKARERDRQALLEQLSQKIAELMRGMQQAAGVGRPQQGYEHEVKAGETLSDIATVYGVGVDEIVKANGLKDRNAIRKGQVLFVPKRGR